MFEILRSSTGYWWRLKAGNGEILCHSEDYTTRQSAQAGIDAVRRVVPGAGTQEIT